MRKIYSLVLLAVGLLIGTNAWADGFFKIERTGVEYDNLNEAFADAIDQDVIQLTGSLTETLDSTAWFGEPTSGTLENYASTDRSITLDLMGNEYIIKQTSSDKKPAIAIALTRGQLHIQSTGDPGKITAQGTSDFELIRVYGTYLKIDAKNETPFTYLIVDENVTLTSENLNAVTIEVPQSGQATDNWMWKKYPLDYSCHFSPVAQFGVSNGVRVDIYGKLVGKKYGMKPSGNIRLGREFYEKDLVNGGYKLWDEGKVFTSGKCAYVFTMIYDLNGKPNNECYKPGTKRLTATTSSAAAPAAATKGFASNKTYTYEAGGGYEWGYNDSIYSPYIHIHSTAQLVANNPGSGKAAGFYSAGYARCLIEGYCAGSTGVYVKSGDVELHDATVTSNWTSDYKTATAGTPGAAIGAGGSAIVIDSNEGWTGSISVTIGGDTKVTTEHGYAIDERITSNDGTNVDYLTITGGTFQGGEIGKTGDVPIYGSVYISQTTLDANSNANEITTINVLGANIEGNNNIGDEEGQITLADFLSGQNNSTHITNVTDENGKTTMVISEGPAPAEDPSNIGNTTWEFIAGQSNQETKPSYAWTAQESDAEIASGTIYLGELQIISGDADHKQILTINDGACLDVNTLIMNDYAQIIVKAGGKLIVEGTQGIVAKKDINIKLESNATKQAIFLFNPGVSSNKHPNATVQYVATKSYRVSANDYQWERFGVPTWKALNSIKCTTADVYSYVRVYENGWQDLGWIHNDDEFANLARMNKPFATYNMLTYVDDKVLGHEKATYVMTGELVGNMDATLNANLEWNAFTNSYSAEIDVKEMLLSLANANYIEKGVYTAQGGGNGTYTWDAVNLTWIDIQQDKQKLAPMQAFILRNEGLIVEDFTLDYEKMVWDPVMDPNHQVASVSGAPRRAGSADDESARLRIIVANEQGTWDNVKLTENATASSLKKYMNDDVNIYAMADEKAAIVAAEDLEDSYFGFSTVKGGEFTISFADVEGREFDLIDLETGVKVAVMEGEAYSFAAAANTVADYRFKLVERAKMPTSIENTEAVKSVKGIYTITGQYLGEMNVWNTLPAGVYVVNGEKLVK